MRIPAKRCLRRGIASIDSAAVRGERQNFDPAGHYFRADVIRAEVDRTRLEPVMFTED